MAAAQPNPQTPYTTVPRTKQVRRVERRLNDDWQYIKPEEMSDYATISETFIAEHNRRASQPTTLEDKRGMTTSSSSFELEGRNVTQSQKQGPVLKSTEVGAKSKTTAAFTRAKAGRNNLSIITWGLNLWLYIQLPFSLLGVAMLGVAGALEAAAAAGGVTGAVAWAVNLVSGALTGIFGVDANITDIATILFFVCYVIVLVLGLCKIFAAYLQYKISLLNPLAGEMIGLKLGALILAIFGYSVPLLNIFPWILLWMAVVWKYPR